MSLGSIQTVEGKTFFIETFEDYLLISLAIKVEGGVVEDSQTLIEWERPKIFNEDEVKLIKSSEDYHKTIAELYYKNNSNYVDSASRMVEISKSLFQYKEQNGRTWKSKLHDLFLNGNNTEPYLQQFRNKYIDVLDSIKNYTTREGIFDVIKTEDSKLRAEANEQYRELKQKEKEQNSLGLIQVNNTTFETKELSSYEAVEFRKWFDNKIGTEREETEHDDVGDIISFTLFDIEEQSEIDLLKELDVYNLREKYRTVFKHEDIDTVFVSDWMDFDEEEVFREGTSELLNPTKFDFRFFESEYDLYKKLDGTVVSKNATTVTFDDVKHLSTLLPDKIAVEDFVQSLKPVAEINSISDGMEFVKSVKDSQPTLLKKDDKSEKSKKEKILNEIFANCDVTGIIDEAHEFRKPIKDENSSNTKKRNRG